LSSDAPSANPDAILRQPLALGLVRARERLHLQDDARYADDQQEQARV
jgi:hypothetical protein